MRSSKADKTNRKSNTTKHPRSYSIRSFQKTLYEFSIHPAVLGSQVSSSVRWTSHALIYLVASGKGGVLGRDRRHLCKTGESFQYSKAKFPEDILVADSSLQPANLSEGDAGGSAGCSPVEPESVSSSPTVDLAVAPPLRRSSRKVKTPERLNL